MSAFVGGFARRSGDVLEVDIGVDFLVEAVGTAQQVPGGTAQQVPGTARRHTRL